MKMQDHSFSPQSDLAIALYLLENWNYATAHNDSKPLVLAIVESSFYLVTLEAIFTKSNNTYSARICLCSASDFQATLILDADKTHIFVSPAYYK